MMKTKLKPETPDHSVDGKQNNSSITKNVDLIYATHNTIYSLEYITLSKNTLYSWKLLPAHWGDHYEDTF
jgi:hypothetical protein